MFIFCAVHFTGDLSWIIQPELWDTRSLRKEYISQFFSHIPLLSSFRQEIQQEFKPGTFLTRDEMNSVLNDIIKRLEGKIEISTKDYLAVMNGIFETSITTRNSMSEFKILNIKRLKRKGEKIFWSKVEDGKEKIKFDGT